MTRHLVVSADIAGAVRADEALLREKVVIARANGRSWGQIGTSLGVSRQAARERFTDRSHRPITWPSGGLAKARARGPAHHGIKWADAPMQLRAGHGADVNSRILCQVPGEINLAWPGGRELAEDTVVNDR